MKKKNKSKSIGSDYERVIAKKLSEWFTGSDEELVCWRTAGSGSVGTFQKKKGKSGKNFDGDFQCSDSRYEKFFNKYFMDSKSLTAINLFMTNPSNQKSNKLLNEWKKVVDDSGDKVPIMFVKVRDDRKIPEFVVIPNHDTSVCYYESCISYSIDFRYDCVIITQDEFFKNNWEHLV